MSLSRPFLTLPALMLLGLAACSILPESEPVQIIDPRLDTETGQHGAPLDWTLNVARPETDPVRDSNRVLVRTPEGQLLVHPTARWVAPAPELLRTALVRHLRDADLLAQVGASSAGTDRTLVIDLRRFELVRDASGTLHVSLQADARLYDSATAERLDRLLFDREIPVTSATAADIVIGVETALDRLVNDIGQWLAGF